MNQTPPPRSGILRRWVPLLLPLIFIGAGIAVTRGGLELPQNGFVGLFLLAVASLLTITSLLRISGRREK